VSRKEYRGQGTGLSCFFRQEIRRISGQIMPVFLLLVCMMICGCAAFPQSEKKGEMILSGADSADRSFACSFSPAEFFQKYISPIDGNRCPMYPSCSAYSMEAIGKYGFIKGWIMTCDRLLRCGRNEMELSPRVIIRGEAYCHDPVSENDLWQPGRCDYCEKVFSVMQNTER